MSIKFRNIAAASCAVVCAVSLTGCSDTGFIGTVNGMQIPTGMYIYQLEVAGYSEASSKITEEKGDSLGTAEVTVFTETIDGKSADQWLKDYALDKVKRYAAVESLFSEYGLTLPAEDQESVNNYIKSMDNDLGYYAQYYGIDESSFSEYYEKRGISKDTMRKLSENSYKEKYVFLYNYDKDGLTPVSDDEIKKYATENYAAVKLLKLDFTDYQGLSLQDDADKQKIRDLAQSYADRANSGEDWVNIQYDYDLREAQLKAWADADDSYAEEKSSTAEASATAEAAPATAEAAPATAEAAPATAEAAPATAETAPATAEAATAEAGTAEVESPAAEVTDTKPVVNTDDADYNKYVQEKIDAATAEKKGSAEDCEQFVNKENSSLDEKVTEYIWNAAADSKATVFENEAGNCIYVVVRDDVTTMSTWLESQRESMLHSIKEDDFDELLKSIYDGYTVELDDYLVNTKYAPEKLYGMGK